MDTAELEECVDRIYSRAGAGKHDVWHPSRLAIAVGLAIHVVPGLYELGRLVNHQLIEVREGLPQWVTEWIIGHELAHFIRGSRHGDAREEAACDYIAAAIQMRRRVFIKRARELKRDIGQLAFDFAVSETSAALRLGETSGRAIAVVTRHRTYARGELAKATPSDLRTWAEEGHPDIRRALLGDDPSRTLLKTAK